MIVLLHPYAVRAQPSQPEKQEPWDYGSFILHGKASCGIPASTWPRMRRRLEGMPVMDNSQQAYHHGKANV